MNHQGLPEADQLQKLQKIGGAKRLPQLFIRHGSIVIFNTDLPAYPHKIQNIFIYMESVVLSREERV
jgi:hypothetical protein